MSLVGRRSTARSLPAAGEQDQGVVVGGGRDEGRGEPVGYRHGEATGTVKSGAGGLPGQEPSLRGQAAP